VPDLALIDIGSETEAALGFCAALKAAEETAAVPIIATAARPDAALRLAALRAGADDIHDRTGDDGYLAARIRSLLRARNAAAVLGLDDACERVLGLADRTASFVPAGRVAIISGRAGSAAPELAELAARLPGGATFLDPAADHAAEGAAAPAPDLFIIDGAAPSGPLGETAALCPLLSDLRSRRATQRAATLVLLPEGRPDLAQLALDLGADDVATECAAPEELVLRVRALLRRKAQGDRLRSRVQSSLEAALTDPLTGLSNRRFAMSRLAELAAAAQAGGRDFAVMILDIDHFKAINDSQGHAAGDRVLVEVARRLRANLRSQDLVARIGGEEFLVAMPDTKAEQARIAAERLRRIIEAESFDTGEPGAPKVRVTLSVGVAVGLPGPGEAMAVAAICDRADRALYAAKRAGRNMVTVDMLAA
jgi:two-component system cell cycle response regulator